MSWSLMRVKGFSVSLIHPSQTHCTEHIFINSLSGSVMVKITEATQHHHISPKETVSCLANIAITCPTLSCELPLT